MSVWSLRREGAVAVATLHRPPRNQVTFAAMSELEELLGALAGDEQIAVIVIASDVPGYFMAHGDLEDLIRLGRGEPFEGDAASWVRVPELIARMPQIVIAAIDGQAWGGGLEFSLSCTLRIAGPGAHFCQPEVPLGMIPGGGGTQRLPRLIGPGRAAELILTGRVVEAREALEIGIVEALLEEEPFLDAAIAFAAALAARPHASLRAAKRALIDGAGMALADGLAREGELVAPLLGRADTIARCEAVLERYAATDPARRIVL